jgi:hypothetical protein
MAFPSYAPTARSFSAGDYAYKTFQAQSGKEVRILYGDKRTGMTLDLSYNNIADTHADDFITHYDEINCVTTDHRQSRRCDLESVALQ